MLPPLLDDCLACLQIMFLHRARSHQGILNVLVQVHYPCVTRSNMLSGIFGTCACHVCRNLLEFRACTRAFGLQMSSSESVAATEESAPSPGASVRPRDFHLQYLYDRLRCAEPFHNCIILRPQVSFFESLLGSTFCNCHLLLYSEERIWVCLTRLSRETNRCLSSSLRLTA